MTAADYYVVSGLVALVLSGGSWLVMRFLDSRRR
jgi:hypothetical protein